MGVFTAMMRKAKRGVPRHEFLRTALKALCAKTVAESVEFRQRGEDVTYRAEYSLENGFKFALCSYVSPFCLKTDTPEFVQMLKSAQAKNGLYHRGQYMIAKILLDDVLNGLLIFTHAAKSERCRKITDLFTIALGVRRSQAALQERIKELTCLYGLNAIVAEKGLALEDIALKALALIPPAFQYPEITSACFTIGNNCYEDKNYYENTTLKISSPIYAHGEINGEVCVIYLKKTFRGEKVSFLYEEQKLLDIIAQKIGLILEGMEAKIREDKLSSQLRHADRLATIGQLAAGVAHELNEPLSSIMGFAQLALKSLFDPAQAKKDLEKIVKASLHAREVVKKLLIFSRQMPTSVEKINLNETIKESLYFIEFRCHKENIDLVLDLAENLPDITADSSQIGQLLLNLTVNAIQAMPQGGKLTVGTSYSLNDVTLWIEDTGIGMDEKTKEMIFLPFFTTKEVGQGTGLGLSVVHGIVKAHNGVVSVESKPDFGTIFEIRFPSS